MVKIIDSIRPYCRKHSICGFLSWKYFYAECCLLNETFGITVKLNSKCPIKYNVYIGNRWEYSWKPLGFNRGIVYG